MAAAQACNDVLHHEEIGLLVSSVPVQTDVIDLDDVANQTVLTKLSIVSAGYFVGSWPLT
jgi:hypothetical protein